MTVNKYERYEELIQRISRRPLRPVVGHSLFSGLMAFALIAKNVLNLEWMGLPLLLLLFLYPYYWVQLAMQWRMRKHLTQARRSHNDPEYVPSSPRGWAAVYGGAWAALAAIVIGAEKLSSLALAYWS